MADFRNFRISPLVLERVMSTHSSIHTIKVHPDTECVPVKAGVDRWTEQRNHSSSDGILTALLELLYFPLVSATA